MDHETRTRYPGAQPFRDDPVSRKVFFGRHLESIRLADQIVANRLVVLYARSGLGKTSLINAGVAQQLRDDGFIPIIIRLNVQAQNLADTVIDAIYAGLKLSDVEYKEGSRQSLWHFFKTVECWREDALLTPVLVLDQFEELFTLHIEPVREMFLSSLGHLVSGIRPSDSWSTDKAERFSDKAPQLRLLISMREDFLGSLEEASDRIPTILKQRFRLLPLTLDSAAEALEKPAQVDNGGFASPAFQYSPEAKSLILQFLSRRSTTKTNDVTAAIEPFQLQLICQRVEQTVLQQKEAGMPLTVISVEKLGGQTGLKWTLGNFYRAQVDTIAKRSDRRHVRRLCEEYLISPEGRRVSMDGIEIYRVLALPEIVLNKLVDARLLRSDQRAEATYYELSHDTLVGPILASRRGRGLALGSGGMVLSIILLILTVLLSLLAGFYVITPFDSSVLPDYMKDEVYKHLTKEEYDRQLNIARVGIIVFLSIVAIALGGWTVMTFRRSAEMLRRFSRRKELAMKNPRNTRLLAGTLAFSLGGLGIQKIYLGHYIEGLAIAIVSILGTTIAALHFYKGAMFAPLVAIILGVVEGVIYFSRSDEQFIAKYIENRRAWL